MNPAASPSASQPEPRSVRTRKLKSAVAVPIVASLNCRTNGPWVDYANLIDAELGGLSLYQTERRLRRLLHDIAELPGQYQLAAARHARRFDEEDVTADRRPGKPCGDARD